MSDNAIGQSNNDSKQALADLARQYEDAEHDESKRQELSEQLHIQMKILRESTRMGDWLTIDELFDKD